MLTPSLSGSKPKIFSATPMLQSNSNRLLLKSDLDSLETVKSMCTDAFNVSSQIDNASFDQQLKFYEHKIKTLTVLAKNESYNQKTADIVAECLVMFRRKAADLTELVKIEKELLRTLHSDAQTQR